MKKDYKRIEYKVIIEETRNDDRISDIDYRVYRIYSSGSKRLVHNQDEIDAVLSRFGLDAYRM